jgi:hypothetical protein
MRSILLRSWLGTGALGFLFVVGCAHGEHACPTCGQATPPAHVDPTPARVTAAPSTGSGWAATVWNNPVVQTQYTEPAPKPAPVKDTHIPRVRIVSVVGSLPAPPDFVPPFGPAAASPEKRRFTGATGSHLFAHAPDYSWIIGEAKYDAAAKFWTVRFGPEEDAMVTLLDPGPMTEVKSGQIVCVEGQLVDPTSPAAKRGYMVQGVHVMYRP